MELIEEGKLPLIIQKRGVEETIFPPRYHPRHATLQEELHAWAASTLGPEYALDVNELELGLLCSTFLPDTIPKPPRRILTLEKLMYWLFLVDDTVAKSCKDPSNQVNALHAHQICSSLLYGIFGCAGADGAAPHAPFQEAIPRLILIALQILSEMREDGMPPTQQARMQSQLTTHLQSLSKEQLLNTSVAPSLEEYTAFRSLPGATGILLLGAEYSLGIELSKEALASPLVKELQAATGDHINWLNDVFSFEKELLNKDHYMNILYVLHTRNNAGPLRVPFDAAVSEAWEMIQRRERDCARLTHEILLSPHLLASSPGVDKYAENLCLITTSNWLWTEQVARYKLQPHPHPHPQASLNAAVQPFRGNALKPLPRIAILNAPFRGNALQPPPGIAGPKHSPMGMLVSRCPVPGLGSWNLAIGK